jgi:hypothetical protein
VGACNASDNNWLWSNASPYGFANDGQAEDMASSGSDDNSKVYAASGTGYYKLVAA